MPSSRHPRLLADLLRARARTDATLLALGGGGAVVAPGTGEVVVNHDLTGGTLDVFMAEEVVGTWLAGGILPLLVPVDFDGRFVSWRLMADDPYAELTVEVWRDTLANLPPTAADIITGAAPPTLAGARSAVGSVLTGWVTTFYAGDVFRFFLRSPWRVGQATLSLKWVRTWP